jgi:hypothetical protein
MSESRFTRSSWVVLGICIVLLGIILALNVYRFGLPTDGWVYVEGNGFTENILGLPSALQPGDLPVSLDRLPFDGTQGTRPESWQAGGTVQYTIQRDGQNMTVAVPIENWNLPTLGRNILNDWRNYLIGLLYSLIGIFVFTRQPGNPAAQVLFLLGTVRLSMTIIFMVPDTLADYLDPFALNAVVILGYYIWGLLLFPTLFLLSRIFPKAKRPYRTHPVLTVFAIYGLLTVISVIHTLIVVRDDPVARAQIRWVGFGVALVAGYQFLSNVIGFFVSTPVVPWWLNVIDTLVYLTLPITIGIAILRYRLFDIDLIIRKTLQYALLTGLLALVYFGSVILLQSLTENLFGEQSPLVIVLSTLAIAALFNPLRIRIQDFIDRRFYRKKYNAEQALSQFAGAARDEVDMEKLTTALLRVVEETMQPEQTSLWLASEDKMRIG